MVVTADEICVLDVQPRDEYDEVRTQPERRTRGTGPAEDQLCVDEVLVSG